MHANSVTPPQQGGRPYRKLIKACAERDICRTHAFLLQKAGVIETFQIGRARFVYLDELDALPTRLKDPEVQARIERARRG
jgi:hypothetical protein